MVLTNYTPTHLLRVIPQLLIVQLGELVVRAARRAPPRRRVDRRWLGDVLRDLSSIRAARRRVNAIRQFPDSEVRRLQARGFARITRFVRGQLHGEDRARAFAESSADLVRELAGSRVALAAWAALFLVLVVGCAD